MLDVLDWQSEDNGRPNLRREFDFAVEVEGDLMTPRIEVGKATEFRWVGLNELDLLLEYREASDMIIRRLVQKGLKWYRAESGNRTPPSL